MKSRLILIVPLALCLLGCATPSPLPLPTLVSPSLTVPCPPLLPRALDSWGDLALAYADALADLKECRARHQALVRAVAP